MIRTIITTIMLAAALTAASAAPAAPIPAKQRIEREFRMLETSIARCMYEEVLPSPDIEFMNRALYEFLRDNPGVTRILRVNAGGFTVSDVTPESPRSAPPRSVSGQRWFQHISQGKAPYYSMDVTPDGQFLLFYAWPLTASSGLETAVTGGFAAYIDLVSQVALIDDAPPFRIVYAGKAIFEHEWEGLDYDEEPLPVKGAKDVMIHTPKPMPTRLDPRAPQTSTKTKSGSTASDAKRRSDTIDDDDEEEVAVTTPGKKKAAAVSGYMNKALFVLLLLIAILLFYSIFSEKINRSVRAWNDTRSMKAQRGTASIQAIPETPPQPLPPPTAAMQALPPQPAPPPQPMLPPQPIITKVITNDNAEKVEKLYKEQQKNIAKMAELIRKKIDVMENRIETLTKRLEELEKELKSKGNG